MAGRVTTPLDVARIKKDFPLLDREVNGHRIVYLDSAASSQRPRAVLEAMDQYYEHHHANVHRGVYTIAEEATAMFEEARLKVARFIGAPSARGVLFAKNVTEGLNLVAQSWGRSHLRAGDIVVLTQMEHHANLVPWLMLKEQIGIELRYLGVTPQGELDLSDLDQKLDGAKALGVAAVSNVLGCINPIRTLADAAHDHGAVVIVDGAQFAPHLVTDVRAMGADFFGFTGHKALGPTGIGVLWGREELLEAMPPFLGGGEMITDVRLDGFDATEIPWKFEAGTPPIAEAVGLGAALDYLGSIGLDAIREHEKALAAHALAVLPERYGDALTIHGPMDPERRSGVCSFSYRGIHPHDLAQVLDSSGVCVRASHHCAKPLMRCLGVGATTRASWYLYNDESDIDTLADAIAGAVEMFT